MLAYIKDENIIIDINNILLIENITGNTRLKYPQFFNNISECIFENKKTIIINKLGIYHLSTKTIEELHKIFEKYKSIPVV